MLLRIAGGYVKGVEERGNRKRVKLEGSKNILQGSGSGGFEKIRIMMKITFSGRARLARR